MQYGDIVTRVAEHRVASIAQQAAHGAGRVAMVDAELPCPIVAVAADSADTALRIDHCQELIVTDTELPLTLATPLTYPSYFFVDLAAFGRIGVVLHAVLVAAPA